MPTPITHLCLALPSMLRHCCLGDSRASGLKISHTCNNPQGSSLGELQDRPNLHGVTAGKNKQAGTGADSACAIVSLMLCSQGPLQKDRASAFVYDISIRGGSWRGGASRKLLSHVSPSITHSLFHSRLKTHLFHKSFPP